MDDLSLSEWRYLAQGFSEQIKTLPKTGTFQPHYNATSWDHDDLYRAAREDAVRSKSGVLQLVADRKAQGAWPRGRYEAKFWLRARWGEATAWAEALAGTITAEDRPVRPPKDTRAVVAWLLYEMWEAELVDYWLAENLGDYTYFETYGTSDEDYAYYRKWLDRLRSGQYLRRSNA